MAKQEKAWTIWFTGMHGAGKSTIASALSNELSQRNASFVVVDGDEARKMISSDLGYSVKDRNEHMKRVAGMCDMISKNNPLVVASVSSPTEESRSNAKKILKKMFLVYVKCSPETCKERDVKGHYKKAEQKKKGFENFLSLAFKYEEPKNPDVVLNTDKETVEESVSKLVFSLESKKIIKKP